MQNQLSSLSLEFELFQIVLSASGFNTDQWFRKHQNSFVDNSIVANNRPKLPKNKRARTETRPPNKPYVFHKPKPLIHDVRNPIPANPSCTPSELKIRPTSPPPPSRRAAAHKSVIDSAGDGGVGSRLGRIQSRPPGRELLAAYLWEPLPLPVTHALARASPLRRQL